MSKSLTLEPIGVARTPFGERADAPRQPRAGGSPASGRIELFAGCGYEDALADLASWDHIWVLFWFDRHEGWHPKVRPPRSSVKRGVFSTRSPRRPNPIGLSALRLTRVEGLVLHVEDIDLLDGTPVLDIKPYVAFTDALPDASAGWLTSPDDPGPSFTVEVSELARAQLDFLADHGVELEPRVRAVLSTGPSPHAYRRIRRDDASGAWMLAVKDWRVTFRVEGTTVAVEHITTGYRPSQLFGTEAPEVHRAFVERWGLSR